MKILVTGGTGYVGKRLTNTLKKKGHTVLTLKTDITDFDAVNSAARGADAIIHLAAVIDTKESMENPMKYFLINAVGTLNVLEAARQNKIKKVVFASSVKVYGKPAYLPIDEKHPTSPISPYGYSKLVAEDFCRAYSDFYGLTVVIARISNLYGPGQSSNLFLPTVLSQLKKDKIVVRNLDFKLDYIYIDDVVSALIRCLSYGKSDVFNFGYGRSVSGKEIMDILSKIAGRKLVVETTNLKKEKEQIIDYRKAKKMLNWEPKIGITEGLKRTAR